MTISTTYMSGRKKYQRPQAMIWADATPVVDVNGNFLPYGYEMNSNETDLSSADLENRFIILSDHNRSPIQMTQQRIEQKQRMANGTMRSYHIADKLNISLSWDMLPSRGFLNRPEFDQETGLPTYEVTTPPLEEGETAPVNPPTVVPSGSLYYRDQIYTADGGAGGVELLDWYENHTGPFWVMLSYDKYTNFGDDNAARGHLAGYSQALQMYVASFEYSVIKRGGNNFDMWNVSVSLEEV